MKGFLSVSLIGNCVADPEFKVGFGGTEYASFRVAVNSYDKKADNNQRTDFVSVKAFGKAASVLSENLSKGDPVFIAGDGRIEEWQGKDGEKRKDFVVLMSKFVLLKKRDKKRADDDEMPF